MMAAGIEGTGRVDVHLDAALRQDSMEGELNSFQDQMVLVLLDAAFNVG